MEQLSKLVRSTINIRNKDQVQGQQQWDCDLQQQQAIPHPSPDTPNSCRRHSPEKQFERFRIQIYQDSILNWVWVLTYEILWLRRNRRRKCGITLISNKEWRYNSPLDHITSHELQNGEKHWYNAWDWWGKFSHSTPSVQCSQRCNYTCGACKELKMILIFIWKLTTIVNAQV